MHDHCPCANVVAHLSIIHFIVSLAARATTIALLETSTWWEKSHSSIYA